MDSRPHEPRRRPSIYDVAGRAGVSHMTVSRVINGHPNIREATRQRVMQAIDDVGYRPSSIARALARSKAMSIGVVVDSPEQFGPNNTLLAIERAARCLGYTVQTFSLAEPSATTVDVGVAEFLTHDVDAVCLIAPRSATLDALTRSRLGVPAVVVAAAGLDVGLPSVGVDQEQGSRLALAHLAHLGHRSVLHVAGPLDWIDAAAREHAWRQTMVSMGVTAPQLVLGDWTSDFGYHVGSTYEFGPDVSAVFASNDQMALGIQHGLRSRRLRVPEDVSVVGFDDIPGAGHFLPPLTTVRQDFPALGAAAVDALTQAIAGMVPPSTRIEPELIIRGSTAAVENAARGSSLARAQRSAAPMSSAV